MTTADPEAGRQAVQQGADALRELQPTLGRPARTLTSVLLRMLRQQDYGTVMSGLTAVRRDLDTVNRALGTLYDQLREAERARAEADPFGTAWWSARHRDLEDEARTGPRDRWRASWIRLWIDALAAGRTDQSDRLAALADASPHERLVCDRMRELFRAFSADRPQDGLAALDGLLGADSVLDTDTAVRLVVLKARIHLRRTGDSQAARRSAHHAMSLAAEATAGPGELALAYATAAEVHLEMGERAEARALLASAQPLAGSVPDPFVIGGLLAERERVWERAAELYDEAVRVAGTQVAHPHLLRPVPANLLCRLARRLITDDPELALTMIDRALDAGIRGKGEHPERKALVDKARILEELHRPAEAADRYGAAADRYAWSGAIARALSLYQKACSLAPEEPAHRWNYAEALRSRAVNDDDMVDVALARRAWEALHAGLALERPTRDHAWVFATEALLADALEDDRVDPVLLLERAVLLAPGFARIYAALAAMLRSRGWPTEALVAARQARALDRSDGHVVRQLVWCLMDVGAYREALEALDAYLDRWVDDHDLTALRAMVCLRLGEPRGALAAVADQTSDFSRLVRGLCYDALGVHDEAVREFETLWATRTPTTGRWNIAWAAYRAGWLDDAQRIMEEVADGAGRRTSIGLDLGQVLLLRGDVERDDLAAGERTLRAAVRACAVPDDLVQFARMDLPVLAAAVGERPHAPRVRAMVPQLQQLADDRCRALRAAVRPASGLDSRVAAVRAARMAGDLEEALAGFRELLGVPELPEVPLAMRAAAEELGDAADRMLDANGNLAGARHAWAVALAAAEAAGPPAADLCARLHARMGLAELELAPDGPTRSLTTALGGAAADGTVPLDEAVEVLARDVPAAWRQYDGLRGLAADPPDARCGRVATALAERVPLRRAYRLDRSEVPPAVVFPLVTPVEVRETGVPSLRTSPTFVPGIKSLRHRLSEQTGIRIPGVCVTASAGGAAKAPVIDILVYDHVLERVMPAVGDDRETVLLARLEDVVRANLYRLINPDDVELWLEGWDAPTPSGGNSWVPPDPPSRLRLVRVLRMLLREGVPVTDRSAVLAGFREAEDQCVPGPLEALRCVRLHLAPEVLASGAIAERRQLPPRLEAELRAGLGRDLAWSWEMDRERVAPLLDSLRAWRQDLPPGDVVVVGDPAVRRCAWRLLGVVGPAIPVLSAEELR